MAGQHLPNFMLLFFPLICHIYPLSFPHIHTDSQAFLTSVFTPVFQGDRNFCLTAGNTTANPSSSVCIKCRAGPSGLHGVNDIPGSVMDLQVCKRWSVCLYCVPLKLVLLFHWLLSPDHRIMLQGQMRHGSPTNLE